MKNLERSWWSLDVRFVFDTNLQSHQIKYLSIESSHSCSIQSVTYFSAKTLRESRYHFQQQKRHILSVPIPLSFKDITYFVFFF